MRDFSDLVEGRMSSAEYAECLRAQVRNDPLPEFKVPKPMRITREVVEGRRVPSFIVWAKDKPVNYFLDARSAIDWAKREAVRQRSMTRRACFKRKLMRMLKRP